MDSLSFFEKMPFNPRHLADKVNRARKEERLARITEARVRDMEMSEKLRRCLGGISSDIRNAASDGKYDLTYFLKDKKKEFEEISPEAFSDTVEEFIAEEKFEGVTLRDFHKVKELDVDFQGYVRDQDFHYRGWELIFKW